jgi:hypothetical protein
MGANRAWAGPSGVGETASLLVRAGGGRDLAVSFAPCGAFARQRRQHDGRGAGFRDFLCLPPVQENRASRGTLPILCKPQKIRRKEKIRCA